MRDELHTDPAAGGGNAEGFAGDGLSLELGELCPDATKIDRILRGTAGKARSGRKESHIHRRPNRVARSYEPARWVRSLRRGRPGIVRRIIKSISHVKL